MHKAPWTPEAVAALNARQTAGLDIYTCPNRAKDHPFCWGHKGVLIATVKGWICPYCDYRLEDWLEA